MIGDRAYGTDAGEGRGRSAAAVAEGLLDGRRAAGAQAPARARPGDRRQPSQLPVVGADRELLEATRFRRVPPAREAAPGDDRACCVYTPRSDRAGHDFGHYGARSDSRFDRLRRCVDERRHFHERADRARSANAARAAIAAGCDVVLHCNGRIEEMRAVADCGAAASPAPQRTRRSCAAHAAPRPAPSMSHAARAEFSATMAPTPSMRERPQHDAEQPFIADDAGRARVRRAGADRRRRGVRGPARSAADARAPAEGRSREDLDPGARRPVSRLHRAGAHGCGSSSPPTIW